MNDQLVGLLREAIRIIEQAPPERPTHEMRGDWLIRARNAVNGNEQTDERGCWYNGAIAACACGKTLMVATDGRSQWASCKNCGKEMNFI